MTTLAFDAETLAELIEGFVSDEREEGVEIAVQALIATVTPLIEQQFVDEVCHQAHNIADAHARARDTEAQQLWRERAWWLRSELRDRRGASDAAR